MKITTAIAGMIVLGAAMMACAVVWSGYVLSLLWAWLLVPTLGVPDLSVPGAIGLALIVNLLLANKAQLVGSTALQVGVVTLGPAIALGVGAVVRMWV